MVASALFSAGVKRPLVFTLPPCFTARDASKGMGVLPSLRITEAGNLEVAEKFLESKKRRPVTIPEVEVFAF